MWEHPGKILLERNCVNQPSFNVVTIESLLSEDIYFSPNHHILFKKHHCYIFVHHCNSIVILYNTHHCVLYSITIISLGIQGQYIMEIQDITCWVDSVVKCENILVRYYWNGTVSINLHSMWLLLRVFSQRISISLPTIISCSKSTIAIYLCIIVTV